jgi:hypothetical protein
MNVMSYIHESDMHFATKDLVEKLQEYWDETEHQGGELPPPEALRWMYDFALYVRYSL